MKQTYLLIVLLSLILVYAVCFTAIKAGLSFLPPLFFGGLRALLGGIVLLVIMSFIKLPIIPGRYEWKWIFWIGLATTITFAGMFLSPGRTGAGIASILGNMAPLFTVLLASVVLHEKLSFRSQSALVLGVLGILFISYPDLFGQSAYGMTGLILALAASGGTAASSILVKQMNNEQIVFGVSAWSLIIGSIPLLLTSFFVEGGSLIVWNTRSVGILLFLVIFGTAFTTAVWYFLIQRHNVGRLSLFFFLIPVFGLGIASLTFNETLAINALLGVFTILVATVILAIDTLKTETTVALKKR